MRKRANTVGIASGEPVLDAEVTALDPAVASESIFESCKATLSFGVRFRVLQQHAYMLRWL